jgi:transcriptional regulator with XRE-family HTH domain
VPGYALRTLRVEAGKTQKELAVLINATGKLPGPGQRLHVTEKYIAKWENNKARPWGVNLDGLIIALHAYLKYTYERLVGDGFSGQHLRSLGIEPDAEPINLRRGREGIQSTKSIDAEKEPRVSLQRINALLSQQRWGWWIPVRIGLNLERELVPNLKSILEFFSLSPCFLAHQEWSLLVPMASVIAWKQPLGCRQLNRLCDGLFSREIDRMRSTGEPVSPTLLHLMWHNTIGDHNYGQHGWEIRDRPLADEKCAEYLLWKHEESLRSALDACAADLKGWGESIDDMRRYELPEYVKMRLIHPNDPNRSETEGLLRDALEDTRESKWWRYRLSMELTAAEILLDKKERIKRELAIIEGLLDDLVKYPLSADAHSENLFQFTLDTLHRGKKSAHKDAAERLLARPNEEVVGHLLRDKCFMLPCVRKRIRELANDRAKLDKSFMIGINYACT